ncbi:ribbon-helix-helix protein, CopG family [bacterium]|nr:ribbon-helix-helix protein, CopG family [bacterium]
MRKQTTVRLPDDTDDTADTAARVRGTSLSQLIVDALSAEIERARAAGDFTERARRLIERDKEFLERLAQ